MRLAIIGLLTIMVCNVSFAQTKKLGQKKADSCHYLKSRSELSGHEQGGPFILEHFRLSKGRTDLREFLWRHWHDRIRGVAEAKVGTVDAGTVTVLYVIQPDTKGQWGIDVEISRPLQPPCSKFHADGLVRLLIRQPDDEYPSQTLGPYLSDGTIPKKFRMADSEIKDSKFYNLILMSNDKAISDAI